MTTETTTKRKPVFGIKGVAEYFGLTADAAQWHIRQGRIPVGRMGKRIVADPDKLDAVISDITSGRAA